MKKYEDFIEGLQQDMPVPEAVWTQYLDTLEHIETLSEERKGELKMGKKKKAAGRLWTKASAAAAGLAVTATLVFGYVNPVAASKLPVIGRIFERVAEDATYSGGYTEKTVLPENTQISEEESVYTASDKGFTITASEVYSDGYSVYLAVEVASEDGNFLNIPAHYTRRFEEKTSQRIQVSGTWKIQKSGEASVLNDSGFEGKAVDSNTFIGMMKLDADQYFSEDSTLELEISELLYEDASAPEAEAIDPQHRIEGRWALSVPFSVVSDKCKEIPVDKTGEDGLCIRKVFVSPYQVIIFTDTPYTSLSPDTYTREDFEEQWGEKNKEILAGGDEAVTYEDMLARKYYDHYELAVYNQDGEVLEMQYTDPLKTVFAVQDHELSKLHIYAIDDSDEYGLARAANEQEAREMSVLNVEVDL